MVKTYQPPNMSANVTAYFFDQNDRHLGVHIGLKRRQMQEQICCSHYHQLGADIVEVHLLHYGIPMDAG